MTGPAQAVEHLVPSMSPFDPLAPGPFAFADPERVRRILDNAGFLKVGIRPHDALLGGLSFEDAMAMAERVGPLGAVLHANPALRPQIRDLVANSLRRRMSVDGKVKMSAAVWAVTATVSSG